MPDGLQDGGVEVYQLRDGLQDWFTIAEEES